MNIICTMIMDGSSLGKIITTKYECIVLKGDSMKFNIEGREYESNVIWAWTSSEAKNLIGRKVIMFNSPDGKDAIVAKLIGIDTNVTAHHHFVSDTRVEYSNCVRRRSRERKFVYIAPIDIDVEILGRKASELGLYNLYTSEFYHILEKRLELLDQLYQKNQDFDVARKDLNNLHKQIIAKTTNCNDLLASREEIKKALEEVESKIGIYTPNRISY